MGGIALLVALATAISFGSCDPVPTEWTITYADGVVQTYSTQDNRLDLSARPGHRFTIVQCHDTACSMPVELVADPLPGDANLDGTVGLQDYMDVLRNWNQRAP